MAKAVDLEEIQNPEETLGGTDQSLMEAADDLMPNTGDTFLPDEPDEQKQEDEEEKAKVTGASPYMDDLIEWFQQQVDLCDSVKNAHSTLEKYNRNLAKGKPNATFDDVMIAHDVVRSILENKLVEMINQKEAWIDPQR